MRMDEIEWRYQGNSVRVGTTWHGQGQSVLMLPALSSISTRREMWPLQQRLGSRFTTLAIDWVGFGDRPRPPLRWSPEIYRSFLAYLLTEVAPRPFATIAAGHAAAYCLDAAAARPGSTGRLCLIAPTWRGPLPTMMGGKHPMFAQISRMVDWPVVGNLLYRLNVNRFMVRKMALGHVYAESSTLSDAQFEEKMAVTRASGARYSSVRFVAGELDPMLKSGGIPKCGAAGQRSDHSRVWGRDAAEIARGDGSFGGFAECCGHRRPPSKIGRARGILR